MFRATRDPTYAISESRHAAGGGRHAPLDTTSRLSPASPGPARGPLRVMEASQGLQDATGPMWSQSAQA
jgi:hypothetical protein